MTLFACVSTVLYLTVRVLRAHFSSVRLISSEWKVYTRNGERDVMSVLTIINNGNRTNFVNRKQDLL